MAVREGLLVLLLDGDRYGYQLKTEWETATGGVWTINVGQIYSTLDRLVRDGLVEVTEAPADDGVQKLYSLTAVGREELRHWWGQTPATSPLPRDGLVVKILLAVRTGPDHALDVITRHRTALTQTLQGVRQAMRARAGEDAVSMSAAGLAQTLVDDAVITRTESDLRWLDQCEARIIRSRAVPDGITS